MIQKTHYDEHEDCDNNLNTYCFNIWNMLKDCWGVSSYEYNVRLSTYNVLVHRNVIS